jgi:flagellar basal-body rod protein FlgG
MTIHALWTAATGMEALKFKVNVIANNLANSSTNGFKRSTVDFDDILYQYLKQPGTDSPSGLSVGLGTKVSGTTTQQTQGPLMTTENNLDWAVNGIGFFQVLNPVSGQTLYTRNGAFQMDNQGNITDSQGFFLQPQITIPPGSTAFNVGADGTVYAQLPGADSLTQIGKVQLTRFTNPAGLQAMGNSDFTKTAASGDPINGEPMTEGFGQVVGMSLEASNVEIVTEMVDLVATQKAYDTSSKVITTADKMGDTANGLIR